MAIQTVGTPEALLQLISVYQGLNGSRPSPRELWSPIVAFLQDTGNPVFRSYHLAGIDPSNPNPQFLGDIAELIKHRFVVLRADGKLELTPVGRCLTFARELPPVLAPLADRMATESRE